MGFWGGVGVQQEGMRQADCITGSAARRCLYKAPLTCEHGRSCGKSQKAEGEEGEGGGLQAGGRGF